MLPKRNEIFVVDHKPFVYVPEGSYGPSAVELNKLMK